MPLKQNRYLYESVFHFRNEGVYQGGHLHLSDAIVLIVQAFSAHFSRDELESINAASSESGDTADKDWIQIAF